MEDDESVKDWVYDRLGEEFVSSDEDCEGANEEGIDHEHGSGVVGGAAASSAKEADDSEGGEIIDENNNKAFDKGFEWRFHIGFD